MPRQIIFLVLLVIIATTGATCRHSRKTSLDETERLKSATISSVNQVVKPTPVQIQTTSEDGRTTTITTAPQSTTTHNLSDNTTASSEASVKEWISWQVGVPYSLCIAALLLSYVFWSRATRVGNIVDAAGAYVANRLTQSNDAKEREQWHGIQNIIDRR